MTGLSLTFAHATAQPGSKCKRCGKRTRVGMYGPPCICGEPGAYTREAHWFCRACSKVVWHVYIEARTLRRQLIHLSWLLGFPATRAHLEAHKRSEQLVLL